VDRSPTSTDIFTYIGVRIPVRCYEHMAIVNLAGASAGWAPEFVREGLSRGHWCYCMVTAGRHAGMLTRLRELGVDVERHLREQTLQFPPESPDVGDLLTRAKRFFAEAESARAPAVRWLEVDVGATPPGISVSQFFELHARLNYLVKHYPSVAVCEYDAEQLEVTHLFSAIAVHRHLLVEDTLVRDNPFYIPAEKFLAMSPEDRERDLRDVYRQVGFDLRRLFSTLAGYGQLQRPAPPGS